jgi:SAM-dependent methyltransferase
MKQQEKDDLFAAHMPGVLHYHNMMLADGVRNKLLARAIRQSVNSDTSFLDIGAGTGVWAILAAKLGAKRVVAVEIEECLIPFIHKHAQENSVAHLIEIIHGRSNDVKIKGKFDVIVSELFGGDAFGAETVTSFIDVRERFLAPDGVLIPQQISMFAVPVHLKEQPAPADVPLIASFLRAIRQNYPQNLPVSDKKRIEYLAEPVQISAVDFRDLRVAPSLVDLTASWKMNDVSHANAIATFNRHTFTEKIEMDSRDSQSWSTGIYPFEPFDLKKGELKIVFTINPKQGNWTVTIPTDPDIRPQSYSPVFAFARVRMSQQMTPHRKFKAPKKT